MAGEGFALKMDRNAAGRAGETPGWRPMGRGLAFVR
jgi:hypothetical protein